jgi:hypothetical protein
MAFLCYSFEHIFWRKQGMTPECLHSALHSQTLSSSPAGALYGRFLAHTLAPNAIMIVYIDAGGCAS